MTSIHAGRLIVILCVWLGSSALPVQALEPALFQAMNLIHFDKPIELPDIALTDLEGKEMRLRTWRGKVLLLNFWTTW